MTGAENYVRVAFSHNERELVEIEDTGYGIRVLLDFRRLNSVLDDRTRRVDQVLRDRFNSRLIVEAVDNRYDWHHELDYTPNVHGSVPTVLGTHDGKG